MQTGAGELGFRLATLVLLVSAFGISIYYRHRAERKGGALQSGEGSKRLVILRLIGLAALLPLLLYVINPEWVAWARFSAPGWLRWLAVALALAALPGIYWLYSTIGNNISPREATRSDHQLVVSGPYRYIRHPLYTFGGIFFAALGVMTTLWWSLAILAIAFVILMERTPHEEANLIARFGDDYRDYMARTGRYLPRLTALK